jgi:hypothetical protein
MSEINTNQLNEKLTALKKDNLKKKSLEQNDIEVLVEFREEFKLHHQRIYNKRHTVILIFSKKHNIKFIEKTTVLI